VSPVIVDSSIDKCVSDTSIKKKKKSIASSASASPQTTGPPLSPTPNIPLSGETKSPNPSLFASIFSSSLNPPITDKVVDTHKPTVELNVNAVKRTKSDTGLERKKFKKSSISPYV